MADYAIYLCDPLGRRITRVQDYFRGRIAQRVNDAAPFWLDLPDYYFDAVAQSAAGGAAVDRDTIVEFSRSAGGQSARSFYYLVRGDQLRRAGQGKWRYRISGYGLNYLLDSRIVAYAAGSAQAEHTDSADDVMKAYVRENLGALTGTDPGRNLTDHGLTVETDQALGVSLTKAASWRNVLRTLQAIADASIQDGTPVFFGIEVTGRSPTTGAIQMVFKTKVGQWGRDLSAGEAQLRSDRDNLRDETLERDWSRERSVIYGLGAGPESARLKVEVTEARRRGATPWNRREGVYDNSRISVAATLTDAANAELVDSRPLLRVTATIAETPNWHYGIDYDFGDKLRAVVRSYSLEVWVSQVALVFDRRGRERVLAQVTSTTALGDSGAGADS